MSFAARPFSHSIRRGVGLLTSLPAIVTLVSLVGCGGGEATGRPDIDEEIARIQDEKSPSGSKMKLTSSAFEAKQPIPKRFTGEGEDVSPPLAWTGAPEGTKAFALLVSDPDAPSPEKPADRPWIHWVTYDLPATMNELPEGVPREETPSALNGGSQGRNSWPDDNFGYRGPLPPAGSGAHRYVFTLYALDGPLGLDPAETTYDDVLTAMRGKILDSATLIGTYEVK